MLRRSSFYSVEDLWTPWAPVSNGGAIASPAGRYLRYEVILTTTGPTLTRILDDITFTWN